MTSVAAINSLGGHAHNPRGNLWFNDDSTYGHKLLMKMGWNKGKGLGKNENGIKENLKVKFRSTNSGLGFKDDAYANVMKTEYESILQNLTAEYSCPKTTSLNKDVYSSREEPMQKSKVINSKLRYPKLFFGKDVTKYSEKDMKSIFICSSTPLKSIERESENSVVSDKKNSENESPKAFDTFSSSLSISDYFAKKMQEKRSNALNKNLSNTNVHQEISLESKITDSFTLTANEHLTSKRKQPNSQVDVEKAVPEQLNHKVKEIKSEQTKNVTLSNKKSSKKRKKKYDNSIEDARINISENVHSISKVCKEDILENSLHGDILHDGKMYSVENTKNQDSRSNKKRKRCQAFENDPVECAENVYSSEIKSSLSPSKKKKKKSKIYSAIIQLPSEDLVCNNGSIESTNIHDNTNYVSSETVEVRLSNNDELKKRKKSKKKLKEKLKSCLKSKHGSYSLKNISFNETVCYRIIDSDTESVEPLACCQNLDESTASYELTNSGENNSSEDAHSEENISSVMINSDDSCSKQQSNISEGSDDCRLSDLPSSKSSHYNAWVESQRQAIKMQLYKKMLKSIRNHKILKTTNLLSIKGYGNWGFK